MRKTIKRNRRTEYLTCVARRIDENARYFTLRFCRGRNAEDAQKRAEGLLSIPARYPHTVTVHEHTRNHRNLFVSVGAGFDHNGSMLPHVAEELGMLLMAATKRAAEAKEGSI